MCQTHGTIKTTAIRLHLDLAIADNCILLDMSNCTPALLWKRANETLNAWAWQCSFDTIHRVDFTLWFEDGNNYSNYFFFNKHNTGMKLQDEISDLLHFEAGYKRPKHLTPGEYQHILHLRDNENPGVHLLAKKIIETYKFFIVY